MTVPSTRFREDYAGNGSATSFPYAFRIFKATDLVVTKTDNSGNETTLTLGTDYTVTGAGSYNGGAVVLTTALPTSYRLTIERVLAIKQETDLRNQGEFLAETHEDAFDRLTMIVQRLAGYLGMGQDGTLRTLLLGTGDVDGAGAFGARQNRIQDLGDPLDMKDAANKQWVLVQIASSIFDGVGNALLQLLASSESGKGATLVGYAAPGGGLARTQADKNRDAISVREYVLAADAGDHAMAWKRAIAQAAGRPIDVSGSWTFLTALDASSYDVHLLGRAAIDATAVLAEYPMTMGGTVGSSAALSADVAKGAAGIVCALDVQPGDIIKIVSTDLWSTERSYYYKGELQRVLSASGGTIYLQGQLNDGYTAATTTITKINPAMVRIDNEIEINRQKDNQGAFLIKWAKDLAVNRLSAIQARERGIYFKECLGGYVADGKTVASFPVGGVTNYGLVYDSCAEIVTLRGNYHAGRHGISTGGTFPCRDLLFDRCIADNDNAGGAPSLDAHANAERLIYRNVICRNGGNIQAINSEVYGMYAVSRNQRSALVFSPARSGGYYSVNGGIFDATSQSNGIAINLSQTIAGVSHGAIHIRNGAQLLANAPFFHIPFASGTTSIDLVEIDSAICRSSGTHAQSGIYIGTNTQNPNVTDIRITNCPEISSAGGGPALQIQSGANTFGTVLLESNALSQAGAFNVGLVQRATLVSIQNNRLKGNGGALRLELHACVDTDCRNNRLTGFASLGGLYLNGTTGQNISINNTTDAASGFTLPSGTIIGYGPHNRRMFQMTATPTTGTYLVGDRWINSSPSVGQKKGEICTVAGAPGTWSTEGNL